MGKYVSDAPLTDALISPLGELEKVYIPRLALERSIMKLGYSGTSSSASYIDRVCSDGSYVFTSDGNSVLRKYDANNLSKLAEVAANPLRVCENDYGLFHIYTANAGYLKRASKSNLLNDVTSAALPNNAVDIFADDYYIYCITSLQIRKLDPITLAVVATGSSFGGGLLAIADINETELAVLYYTGSGNYLIYVIAKATLSTVTSISCTLTAGNPGGLVCKDDVDTLFGISTSNACKVVIGKRSGFSTSSFGSDFSPKFEGVVRNSQGIIKMVKLFDNYVLILRNGTYTGNYDKFFNIFNLSSGALVYEGTIETNINWETNGIYFSDLCFDEQLMAVFVECQNGGNSPYVRFLLKIPVELEINFKIKGD